MNWTKSGQAVGKCVRNHICLYFRNSLYWAKNSTHCSLSKIHQLTIWRLRKGLWPSSQVKKSSLDYGQTWFCGSVPKDLSQLQTPSLLKRVIKTHCMNFPFCLTFKLACQCWFAEQGRPARNIQLVCTINSVHALFTQQFQKHRATYSTTLHWWQQLCAH